MKPEEKTFSPTVSFKDKTIDYPKHRVGMEKTATYFVPINCRISPEKKDSEAVVAFDSIKHIVQ